MQNQGLENYAGQTVTVFTESGGASGSGFTGVLLYADCNVIKLLTQAAPPPAWPLRCNNRGMFNRGYNYNNYGYNDNYYYGGGQLGSVIIIPTEKVVGFTHYAV